MPLLNWEKTKTAKPIAVVRGGDDDGKILYLHIDEKAKGSGKKDIDPVAYMKELTHLKPTERTKVISEMVESVGKGVTPESFVGGGDETVRKVYAKMATDSAKDTSVTLPPDSMFMPIPDPDPTARQIWYAAGISGSGKSYFARGIAENYKKLFPDREIYLISKYPVDEDDTLGKMKILCSLN